MDPSAYAAMTLQQLEYFLTALRLGSFSAAADELLLAQPSISEQVRRLEAELGVRLFERVGRGIVPTEAGRALRPHAESVLAAVAGAREAVAAQRELREGVISFGTWGSARFYPSAAIVAEFRTHYPRMRVRLVGQNSSEVADDVRDGHLEAGMVALPIDDRGLDVRPVMQDDLVLCSADPEALRGPVSVEQLASRPLVLSDASFGGQDPTRRQLDEAAQRAGRTLVPEVEVEDLEAALALAGEGHADTVVSRGILLALGAQVPDALGWQPFAEPLQETMAFVSRRGARLSPAAQELMRIAEEHLQALRVVLETRPPRSRPAGGR